MVELGLGIHGIDDADDGVEAKVRRHFLVGDHGLDNRHRIRKAVNGC
ncbi:MAG: hypothetical protein UY10_C0017G0011 [Microgenomates group bacterium GW2011_GWA2_47_8]|nr:MAG: hypothetical protein UY10_C0017G0011 [Microgenomates group bacterium GW2011_GWA2_47_8]